MPRSPYSGDSQLSNVPRNIPILPSSTQSVESSHGDPMDVSSAAVMGPPVHSSPELDHTAGMQNGMYVEATSALNGPTGNGVSAAAATASQQPKIVQTAFIHKLYKCDVPVERETGQSANAFHSMLEDPSIQHLISWSNNNESFLMSPSTDFSKVLASVVQMSPR